MYVKIEDLLFQYRNAKTPTIQNFSLNIEKGEVVSILGDSGSGKSTILRLIAGLEIPQKGSISINGQKMIDDKHFTPPEKRGIGMVFQDYCLFPHMTVANNIKFGLKKLNRKQKQERLEEMLTLVNLQDFKDRYPYELSGGQQQRVALARALAPAPSLLIFDEPFSNLDRSLQEKIREELRVIIKQTGITSILVTHDEADAKALADRIVYVKEGKISRTVTSFTLHTNNKKVLTFS
ncbi:MULTISPECIES: ABC transporter ATP-binding protein [Sutcliffiella]|uniref:Carnitine transport ATP-binding protein OpuCA n=1 Tax=Sutcliffiella cohnii TaxID=33932 RepID=A0A223KWM2_9BACI|nr:MULTISPECIES: ABC transporter ATP-binding protein [Sutcliffiella]AST93856.1 ABC transporter [Sutcliffiella cohnii]MED4015814.1 ABC transporter ATP-binding protein [Sutcliffiella cohnii]WBL15048.1 ABC transporter ATP-binding protein [Sutcliffiella sp. NC1]